MCFENKKHCVVQIAAIRHNHLRHLEILVTVEIFVFWSFFNGFEIHPGRPVIGGLFVFHRHSLSWNFHPELKWAVNSDSVVERHHLQQWTPVKMHRGSQSKPEQNPWNQNTRNCQSLLDSGHKEWQEKQKQTKTNLYLSSKYILGI